MTSFDEYCDRYENIAFSRGDDGVIEMRVHTDGGPLAWSAAAHRDIGPAFSDATMDPENKVILFSGTGDAFCDHIDHESFRMQFETDGMARSEGRRLLHAVVDVDIPVVGVVNGPASIHAELVVMSDIVIAADTAYFADHAHFPRENGVAPGDGVHLVWPFLLGPNRGRHFLISGYRLGAEEAQRLGVVAEVVPAADAYQRGLEVARDLATRPVGLLHHTREILIGPWRALINTESLGYGMGHQRLSPAMLGALRLGGGPAMSIAFTPAPPAPRAGLGSSGILTEFLVAAPGPSRGWGTGFPTEIMARSGRTAGLTSEEKDGRMARPSSIEEDFVISLIVRTSRALNVRMRRGRSAALQPLTPVHLVTLAYVRDNPGVTLTDLGRHLNVTKQAAWDVVATLEDQGVLTRVPHPTDGRSRVLVPTEKDEELVQEGRERWAKLEHELLETIGRERAAIVRDALVAYLETEASDDVGESADLGR